MHLLADWQQQLVEALISLDALRVVKRPVKRNSVELRSQQTWNDSLDQHPPTSIADQKSLKQANPFWPQRMQPLEVQDIGAD